MSVLDASQPAPPTGARTLTVALAGNPNSGKTTIFNALTGLRQKTANYPGVTVEKKVGKLCLEDGQLIDVIDLPGAYSLISRSPDEVVTMQVLRGLRPDTPAPDVVIAVVDASNLQRNLYLVSQLIELGKPLVIALNMADVAQRRGIRLSASRLGDALGVPVIPVVGHKKQGVEELKRAIKLASVAPVPRFPLPEPMWEEVERIASVLNPAGPASPRDLCLAERLLIHDHATDLQPYQRDERLKPLIDNAQARFEQAGLDPMQADIEAHYHWIDQIAAQAIEPACEAIEELGTREDKTQETHGFLSSRFSSSSSANPLDYAHPLPLSDRLDRVFLHKIWGMLTFAGIMASLFVAIFIVADPLMGATEEAIAWLGGLLTGVFPEGPLRDLWTDGIVAGVGGVLVFVPQIAMLFLFLAILEDSGYLARAAFLMDRVLGKLGLNGKSFIPLLSSFACAIPGIMATRTIENRRDRLATIFVAPFMSCSARLPVYTLLIGAFFASFSPLAQGGIMFACYALGVVAAVLTALLFRKTFLKSAPSSFVLELPTYKLPQITQVIRVMVTNTWAFVRRAGTIIFCLSVILWAMAYYPRLEPYSPEQAAQLTMKFRAEIAAEHEAEVQRQYRSPYNGLSLESLRSMQMVLAADGTETRPSASEQVDAKLQEFHKAAQLEQSISGRIGHFIEPVIRPLGYDWKMGVGLIASFAAREVFVSQMGIVYAAGDAEEDAAPLEEAMRADTYADGSPVWTTPVAISLLVWFVLAMQCISTTAIVKRETGSWAWALGQIAYMNGLAYVCALIAYEASSALIG